MKKLALPVAAAAALVATAASAAPLPNYVPGFNVKTGVVAVKNVGAASPRRSFIAVRCVRAKYKKRVDAAKHGPGCPDPTAAQAAPYLNPALPNAAAVKTPPLKAGGSFQHKIAFFPALIFPSGQYKFQVCVDATKTIVETNEGDNCKVYTKVVN